MFSKIWQEIPNILLAMIIMWLLNADKQSFHYSDGNRIQYWETQTESMFLSFSLSEFLSFEFPIH